MGKRLTDDELLAKLNGEAKNLSDDELLSELNGPSLGFKGIGQDIASSFKTLPSAIGEMLTSLPSEAYESGSQVINDPLRAGSNVAGGAVKGLRGMANIPHNIRQYLLEKEIPLSKGNSFPYYEQTGIEDYLMGGEPQPGDPLLQGIGQYMAPYSRFGSGVKGAKGVAQRTGGLAAMGVGDEEMDPIHTAMMGLLGEGLSKGPKKGAEIISEINPLKSSDKKVIKGVELPDVQEVVEAANRLGLDYVTPGEASGFGYVGKQEGKIGNTLEGSKLREKKAKSRAESEEVVINDFLNKLDDKIELPKDKQALYDSVMGNKVPQDFVLDQISNNEIIEKAIKNVETDPVYRQALKGVPADSFKYWDQIKKALDDMEESAMGKHRESTFKSKTIGETRKNLIKKMDTIDPNYAKARKLGQRSILRREIEHGFDKKDMTGKNFYNTVIKSKSNFEKLYNDLSEFPEMQQQLNDMKTVFPNLMGTADAKAAAAGERGGYGTPRADLAWLARFIEQQFNETGDVNKVKSITSKDWYESLKKKESPASQNNLPGYIQKAMQDLFKSSTAEKKNDKK